MSRRRTRLVQLTPQIAKAAGRGLYKAANAIINDSLQIVPVETGTLKASARVLEPEYHPGHVEVRAGYGYGDDTNPITGQPAGGYALAVHERTDLHHAPPTQDHFLSKPALEHSRELGETVSVEIGKELGRGRRVA